jgi:hypothetical protein
MANYIRVHHAEFVAGTIGNGVSLNELMDELGQSFMATQRNAGGRGIRIRAKRIGNKLMSSFP